MVLTFLTLIVTGIYVVQFQKWVSTVERLDDSWIKPLLLSTTNPYGRLLGIVLFLLLIGGVIADLSLSDIVHKSGSEWACGY